LIFNWHFGPVTLTEWNRYFEQNSTYSSVRPRLFYSVYHYRSVSCCCGKNLNGEITLILVSIANTFVYTVFEIFNKIMTYLSVLPASVSFSLFYCCIMISARKLIRFRISELGTSVGSFRFYSVTRIWETPSIREIGIHSTIWLLLKCYTFLYK
jgi:hypothetical protein